MSDSPRAILEIEGHRDAIGLAGGEDASMERTILQILGIENQKKFGRYLLGVAIPVGVTLVFSSSPIVQTTEMRIVAVLLPAAIVLTCNGVLLSGDFPKASSWMLLSGAGLLLISVFALFALFLPHL